MEIHSILDGSTEGAGIKGMGKNTHKWQRTLKKSIWQLSFNCMFIAILNVSICLLPFFAKVKILFYMVDKNW